MHFNALNIVMLLAAAQALLLAALVVHKYRSIYANRFLAALLAVYGCIILSLLVGDMGFNTVHPDATMAFIGLGLAVAPLHYWYARHLVAPSARWRRKDWIHLLPFLVYEGYALVEALFLQRRWSSEFPLVAPKAAHAGYILFNWAVLAQVALYGAFSLRLLRKYSRRINDVFSSTDRIAMSWLRNISCLALVAVAAFFIENLVLLSGIRISTDFNLSSFLVAAYVYALGYLGLLKSEVLSLEKVESSINELPERHEGGEPDGGGRKYERSGLAEEKADACLERLHQLMQEEAPYADPELTLNQLADLIPISAHNLSEILNTRLHQSFYEFVNGRRVEKVKADLADSSKKHLKLLAIAYDAGFRSKSSFNSIFKKLTGMTPSEYRKRVEAAGDMPSATADSEGASSSS